MDNQEPHMLGFSLSELRRLRQIIDDHGFVTIDELVHYLSTLKMREYRHRGLS